MRCWPRPRPRPAPQPPGSRSNGPPDFTMPAADAACCLETAPSSPTKQERLSTVQPSTVPTTAEPVAAEVEPLHGASTSGAFPLRGSRSTFRLHPQHSANSTVSADTINCDCQQCAEGGTAIRGAGGDAVLQSAHPATAPAVVEHVPLPDTDVRAPRPRSLGAALRLLKGQPQRSSVCTAGGRHGGGGAVARRRGA